MVAKTSTDVPSRIEALSQVSGVLGCQWGDEGKGKLVDILAKHFDIVARCQVLFNLFINLIILRELGFMFAYYVCVSDLFLGSDY